MTHCLSLPILYLISYIFCLLQILTDLVQGEFMQLGSRETENERFAHYLTKTYRKTASLIANALKAVSTRYRHAIPNWHRRISHLSDLSRLIRQLVCTHVGAIVPIVATAIDFELWMVKAYRFIDCVMILSAFYRNTIL